MILYDLSLSPCLPLGWQWWMKEATDWTRPLEGKGGCHTHTHTPNTHTHTHTHQIHTVPKYLTWIVTGLNWVEGRSCCQVNSCFYIKWSLNWSPLLYLASVSWVLMCSLQHTSKISSVIQTAIYNHDITLLHLDFVGMSHIRSNVLISEL